MTTGDDQYARIMDLLGNGIPGVAQQVKREVRHGRVVSEQDLRKEARYEETVRRLSVNDLSPLGKTDVAAVPYTDDERLELIRSALLTLAETMYASRAEVLKMSEEFETDPVIVFGDAEFDEVSVVNMSDEVVRVRQSLLDVRELLVGMSDVEEAR
ncbi:hypothetical protein ACFOWZ_12600 [Lentzea rhizosphaerae]|uniref:Uncharacterized protein n=1 Tax=Lentzea rhizosphaerae TaxID=2041025 RepID=A0ABV8BPZ8_9PSEU